MVPTGLILCDFFLQAVTDKKLRMVSEQLTEANAKVGSLLSVTCVVHLIITSLQHMISHDHCYTLHQHDLTSMTIT